MDAAGNLRLDLQEALWDHNATNPCLDAHHVGVVKLRPNPTPGTDGSGITGVYAAHEGFLMRLQALLDAREAADPGLDGGHYMHVTAADSGFHEEEWVSALIHDTCLLSAIRQFEQADGGHIRGSSTRFKRTRIDITHLHIPGAFPPQSHASSVDTVTANTGVEARAMMRSGTGWLERLICRLRSSVILALAQSDGNAAIATAASDTATGNGLSLLTSEVEPLMASERPMYEAYRSHIH
ncbi:hypothetical protein K431DRAFT_84111 [Polychaeton citri CBS 116435]|uniref:Uncharacterized protein n=1 Tax=Polychaeton citri CBS 116435 TaxID=1314669 RepID=A0A9P4QAF5_9PEZI|nr:hypothetical protein K431DRAFT_84111 [Polychaeton citri CBS 116435]